jgi:hypothetical protein
LCCPVLLLPREATVQGSVVVLHCAVLLPALRGGAVCVVVSYCASAAQFLTVAAQFEIHEAEEWTEELMSDSLYPKKAETQKLGRCEIPRIVVPPTCRQSSTCSSSFFTRANSLSLYLSVSLSLCLSLSLSLSSLCFYSPPLPLSSPLCLCRCVALSVVLSLLVAGRADRSSERADIR